MIEVLPMFAAMVLPAAASEGSKAKENEGLPLAPTRRIEFETDEATWLSLDVSPDGRSLLLEIAGDLYTLPIEGGEARAVLTGPPFESQPRFSPDGTWVAFLSDRNGAENVWIAKPDGSGARKLSDDKDAEFASPAWSADGRYVIASRTNWGQATYELWMYHVDGGAGVQLTKAKPDPKTPRSQRSNALGAVASRDGRYLYYSRKNGGFQYNATFPLWQIARMDLRSGDEDILTQEQGSAIRPLLSPDGSKLVYGTRFDAETGLRIRDLSTGADRWLRYPVQRDDQESAFTRDLLPGYAFTPDGRHVVTTEAGKIVKVDVATGQATPIAFTAKVAQDLGPSLRFPRRVENGPVRARLIQDPTVSPDGRRLAFSSLTRLYVMELPSGTPAAVLPEGTRAFQPSWSPDGNWIAYATWSGGEGHIERVRASGGTPERLTRVAAFYSDPVWSPDGTRVVALRAGAYDRFSQPEDFGAAPGMDLVFVPAAGGDASLILPARGLGKPHFGSDPDRVYLYLTPPGFGDAAEHGLVSLRFDGTDWRQHLKVVGPGIYMNEEPVGASDARMSPDGRWALARVSNQLYLIAVPPVGQVPTVDVGKPAVPAKKLTDVGADYFGWDDGGNGIHWAIGSTLFRRRLASVGFAPKESAEEVSEPAPFSPAEAEAEVERIEVEVDAPRAAPEGVFVLRGARVVTLRGDEVLNGADVVVRGSRIESVGGRTRAPEGARVIDVRGKTIVPGFVDTHAHWFEIPEGNPRRRQLELPREPRLWSDGGPRRPDEHQRHVRLPGHGGYRRGPGTAGLLHRPGDLLRQPFRFPRPGEERPQPLQGALPHAESEVVHRGEPEAAPARGPGGTGARDDADDRGGPRPEARPHPRPRRLQRQRAQLSHRSSLQGRGGARGALRHQLHPDAPGGLRRSIRRELLLHFDRGARRREAEPLPAAQPHRLPHPEATLVP